MKSILCASATLAACMVLGGVSENFDNKSGNVAVLTTPGVVAWAGDGTVGNDVLAVEGQVTCANDAGAPAKCASCKFKVTFPADGVDADELTEAAGGADALADCQIALATGAEDPSDNTKTKLVVMVYTGYGWTDTGLKVEKGSTADITLNFDYSAKKCQVKIGNDIATTGKATTKDDEPATGGWYPLVKTISETMAKVNSLAFVGSTTVDDVNIAEVSKAALPAELVGLNVDPTVLNSLGVTEEDLNDTTEGAVSGLTVLQKLECGFNPKTDDKKFAPEKITGTDTEIALTLPCDYDNGQQYVLSVSDENHAQFEEFSGDSLSVAIGNGKAKVSIYPNTLKNSNLTGKVLKFKVKAMAPQSSAK